jgi:NAD(P)-dependent dehydrogenase (short-subunit alcohol dehydrogenase family)
MNPGSDNEAGPVLVTGGGGAIGRAVAARFARAGRPVAVLERDPGTCAAAQAWFASERLAVTVTEADVGDPAAAAAA